MYNCMIFYGKLEWNKNCNKDIIIMEIILLLLLLKIYYICVIFVFNVKNYYNIKLCR